MVGTKPTTPKKDQQSPSKTGGLASAKPSPSRGRALGKARSITEVNKNQPRAKGTHLNGCLLYGQLGYITLTQPDRLNDAFSHHVSEALTLKDINDFINTLGIIGSFFMRRSLEDPRPLLNAKDSYTKKTCVVYFPLEKHNKEGLLHVMQLFKAWCEMPVHQRYPTKYHLDEDKWDDTPPEGEDLLRLDNVFQYEQIVNIIKLLFDKVDETWYKAHADEADCFFHAGHVPFEAVMDLGYPVNKVLPAVPQIGNVERKEQGKPKLV